MNIQPKTILIFAAKFIAVAPVIWLLWWWILPQYAWLIGQIAGTLITFPGQMPIEAMRVESREALILNANTSLIYTYNATEHPIHIASLVSNLPPLLILILATPAIKLRPAIRALAIGTPIIAAGHILFITLAFILQSQIQNAPEIPTAIGYVFLTLPFILWIILIHWQTLAQYLNTPEKTSAPVKKNNSP